MPWASIIDPKTGKKKAKIKPVATGLWCRYGNPIIAPDAFLNLLALLPAGRRVVGGARELPALPVDLRRRHARPALHGQDRLRGLLQPAAGQRLLHRRDQEHQHGAGDGLHRLRAVDSPAARRQARAARGRARPEAVPGRRLQVHAAGRALRGRVAVPQRQLGQRPRSRSATCTRRRS